MSHILVVSSDGRSLTNTLGVLNKAGYEVSGASTFEEAKQQLATVPPDLVIADERLGEFNGLHVILRARCKSPTVAGIVTTPSKNRGLEADALKLNVQCLTVREDPSELLLSVSRTLTDPSIHALSAGAILVA